MSTEPGDYHHRANPGSGGGPRHWEGSSAQGNADECQAQPQRSSWRPHSRPSRPPCQPRCHLPGVGRCGRAWAEWTAPLEAGGEDQSFRQGLGSAAAEGRPRPVSLATLIMSSSNRAGSTGVEAEEGNEVEPGFGAEIELLALKPEVGPREGDATAGFKKAVIPAGRLRIWVGPAGCFHDPPEEEAPLELEEAATQAGRR